MYYFFRMGTAPDSFTFSQVPSSAATAAFSFHGKIASTNAHIWPRTRQEIEEFARSGQLFGARRTKSGDFVALCYVALDDREQEWELGGLIVAEPVQKLGVGTFLIRFALAHTMVYLQPWKYEQQVIAYVHEANNDPRKLLEGLGFEKIGRVEVPEGAAPNSMKRNELGKVAGDKFRFSPDGLRRLSAWFNEQFNGTLGDGSDAKIHLAAPATIENLKQALKDIAKL